MSQKLQEYRRGDKALLIVPQETTQTPTQRAWRLSEAESLVCAIELDLIHSYAYNLKTIRPDTFITKGHLEEIEAIVAAQQVHLIVFDSALSPIQQRNLEKTLQCKIIDRTGLILEIFGERARTAEGVLQVELAALTYQRSRLVRTWTHLERQRGGLGFIGGPGESQIELDRRMIDAKIVKIQKKLEKVRKTRALHRKKRQDVPLPVVSFVGYTNAGKSTLFNGLTKAKVFAKDMPFATLDPTMRQLSLESGLRVILSDTVGFISGLPTQLVAAFRATLEEVQQADLLVHVIDYAHPQWEEQEQEVLQTLADMGVVPDQTHPMLRVYNKIDLLENVSAGQSNNRVYVSATQQDGFSLFKQAMSKRLLEMFQAFDLTLAPSQQQHMNWIYAHGVVRDVCEGDEGAVCLSGFMRQHHLDQLKKRL